MIRETARRAVRGFFDDGAPQSAAAISYYGLISLFPLAILLVSIFGVVVDDDAARERVVGFVLENVPLTEGQGRSDLEELLVSVTDEGAGFGVFGAIGLVVAASGVMGAIRKALNRAWDVRDARPPVQGKLVDVLLVGALGLVVVASFALTLALRLTASLSGEVADRLGPAGAAVPRALLVLGQALPALVAFGAFLLLFRIVPATRTHLRDVWPGAAVAAVGFEAAKTGFAVYLENFANYNAVYASLAAIVAFLVFLFVAAMLALLGAEVAVEWPHVRDGAGDGDDDTRPWHAKLRDGVRGLFVRDRVGPAGRENAGRSGVCSAVDWSVNRRGETAWT